MYHANLLDFRTLVRPAIAAAVLTLALRFYGPYSAAFTIGSYLVTIPFWAWFLGRYVEQGAIVPNGVMLKPVQAPFWTWGIFPALVLIPDARIKIALSLAFISLYFRFVFRSSLLFWQSFRLFLTYPSTDLPEWKAPPRWVRLTLAVFTLASGLAWSWLYPLVLYVSLLPLLVRYAAVFRRLEEIDYRSAWEKAVEACPPDHLYLGRFVYTGKPMLLHKKLISENAIFFGSPGSRKSTEMLSLALQLLRQPDPPAIFWCTGKLDLATFNALWQATERGFQMFTLDRTKSSLHIDGLETLRVLFDSVPHDLSDAILSATGAWYGDGYGRSYFHGRGRKLLFQVLSKAVHFPRSFAELSDLIDKAQPDDKRDADEMVQIVSALANHERLNPSSGVPLLNVEQAIINRQVTHLAFPAAISQVQSHETIGIVLYAIFHTARKLYEEGRKARVVVFLDEAQNFVTSSNVATLMAEGRQFGCSFVLACQSEAQLKTPDGKDFRDEVKDLCRVRVHLTVSNRMLAQELMALSGQKIERLYSDGLSMTSDEDGERPIVIGQGISGREYRATRLEPNDIALANAERRIGIVITQDEGFTQTGALPTLYRGDWPIDPPELYDYLESQPWPAVEQTPLSPPKKTPKREKKPWIDIGEEDTP